MYNDKNPKIHSMVAKQFNEIITDFPFDCFLFVNDLHNFQWKIPSKFCRWIKKIEIARLFTVIINLHDKNHIKKVSGNYHD